jgi:hypothetical protein
MVLRFERAGESEVCAVLKDGTEETAERLEPGCGDGRRGVAY